MTKHLALVAKIVSAYVTKNPVPADKLSKLIEDIHQSLISISSPPSNPEEHSKPAVPIGKSVNDDFIVCLEDGKKFKSLKRHLSAHHGLTPAEYRVRWNLPLDYPITAASYTRLAMEINSARKQISKANV